MSPKCSPLTFVIVTFSFSIAFHFLCRKNEKKMYKTTKKLVEIENMFKTFHGTNYEKITFKIN